MAYPMLEVTVATNAEVMKNRPVITSMILLASASTFAGPSRVGTVGAGGTSGPSGTPTMISPSSSAAPAGPQNNRAEPDNTVQNNIPTNNPAPNILTNNTPMPRGRGKVNEFTNAAPGAGGLATNFPGATTNSSPTVTNAPRRHHHWWQWH